MLTITNNSDIKVNDNPVSLEQLQEMMKDRNKRLVEIAPNRFKLLEKLLG